jgi:hypothetical protein
MSSMKTTTNLSSSCLKTEFMRYMKYAGALVRPNDMTRYSYRPYQVEKAVFGMSLDRILI